MSHVPPTSEPLPFDLQNRVDAELERDERLLWTAQPSPGRYMRQGLPFFLFGIPFTGFAVFWIFMAVTMTANGDPGENGGNGAPEAFHIVFPLFGLPFVLVGLGMLSVPLWMRRKARKVCYALTDRRAILWEPEWTGGITVRSYGPDDLKDMSRRERADGSGDLIFEEYHTYSRRGHSRVQRRGFLGIDRVHEVERFLRDTLLPE